MKQQLKKISKLFLPAIFFSAYFLPISLANVVQAADCTWAVDNYWVSPTTASRTDTLNFNADVTRTGSPSECQFQPSYSLKFYAKLKGSSCSGAMSANACVGNNVFMVGTGEVGINGDKGALRNLAYNLSGFNSWNDLSDINKIPIYVVLTPTSPGAISRYASVTKDNGASVTVSGESGYSTDPTVATVVVSFDQSTVASNPDTEMPLRVYIKVLPSEQTKLVANQIKILTYINDKWNGLQITRSKSDCGNTYCLSDGQSTYQDIEDVSSSAGFTNGVNTITVKIFPSNSDQLTGTGSGKMSVTGIQGGSSSTTGGSATSSGAGGAGTNASTSGSVPTDRLINPLPNDDLIGTFLSITKGLLAGLAIWTVISIIVAAFRMVVAAGNEEAITQAKKSMTWAIIGLLAALLSFSIVAIVQNVIGADLSKINTSGYYQTQPKHLA